MDETDRVIEIMTGWDIDSFLLPLNSHHYNGVSFVPWVGVRRASLVNTIEVAIVRESASSEQVFLSISDFEKSEPYREIKMERSYFIGMERLFFDTDSVIDPSRIEIVRVYSSAQKLYFEFGLSRVITGMIYVNEG